ncbi:hypothetical protein bcgnr5378_30120 [Bacillus cereus]|uniref:Uncharacterized protein n=1 Tax=Bacillus cereus TaxID=1396 RepID=A0A161R776_BACCE|nr:hypothetical protein [Bacillus cereus]KZD72101.1 hypothetical protein B4088_0562 [Bacillus cereus]
MGKSRLMFVGILTLGIVGLGLVVWMITSFYDEDESKKLDVLTVETSQEDENEKSQDVVNEHKKNMLPSVEQDEGEKIFNKLEKPYTFENVSFTPEKTIHQVVLPNAASKVVGKYKEYFLLITDNGELYLDHNGDKIGISEGVNKYAIDSETGVVYYSKHLGILEKIFRFDPANHDHTEMHAIYDMKLSQLDAKGDLVSFTYFPFRYGKSITPENFQTKWIRYLKADRLQPVHEKITAPTNENPAFFFNDSKVANVYFDAATQSINVHQFDLRTLKEETNSEKINSQEQWSERSRVKYSKENVVLFNSDNPKLMINNDTVPLTCGVADVEFIDEENVAILGSCLKLELYNVKTKKLKKVREDVRSLLVDKGTMYYQSGSEVYELTWKKTK